MCILYIPNDGIGTEILIIRPSNTMVSRANQIKIFLVSQVTKSTAFEIWFDIKNSRYATTTFYLNFVVF